MFKPIYRQKAFLSAKSRSVGSKKAKWLTAYAYTPRQVAAIRHKL